MADAFESHAPTLESPASDAFAITPHDSTDFTEAARSIYVGNAGNISLVTVAGTAVTFNAVAAGSILPVRASRVNDTGTTATNLVGLI